MKFGIIIQGGYVEQYTKNVVLFYRTELPEAYICLSIWDIDYIKYKEEIDSLQKIDKLIILKNSKPKISGHSNINYQIVSTLNAISQLRKIDDDLVIFKTRTDFKWENLFDIYQKYKKSIDNNKIVALYPTNLVKNPFIVPDYFFLGKVYQLYELFDIPLSSYGNEREVNKFICSKYEKVISFTNSFIWGNNKNYYAMPELAVEAYITTNYFKKLGYIIPKNNFLLHFFSVHLIVKHFELINSNDIKFSNIKNHTIASDETTFQYFKTLVLQENHLKLFWLINKKIFKEWIYKYKSYLLYAYILWKKRY